MTDLKTDPAYHDGFFDAQDGEPLFPGASAPYEAGWRAFWRAREILASNDFVNRAVISETETSEAQP